MYPWLVNLILQNADLDEPLPTNEKERKKIIKQRKLQEKANRIIAEAVAKARAAGKIDIPKVHSSTKWGVKIAQYVNVWF